MTDDTRTIRAGQVGVYGTIEPETDLSWQELAPGRFASTPVPFDTLGSFRVRVEAHLVDLPPGADARVLENLRKLRAQIADFESKMRALESQPGDHGAAIFALAAALENRRAALRRLLATLGGYAETAVSFVVFGVPLVLSGDGQTGVAGSQLASPLVLGLAKVDRETRLPQGGIAFHWSSESGMLDAATTVTGATGETSNRFSLSSTPGRVSIYAEEEVGGQGGPRVELTATGEEPETAPSLADYREIPLDLMIPSDGRTSAYQTCIVGRGNDLLPMIVRVVHPAYPDRHFPLVPVGFHVLEGTGHFLHVDGLAIYSNGRSEAGLYFVPTSPGRNVVRAQVFLEASAEAESVYFYFDAQAPKLTDEGVEPRPCPGGSALERPFRVRATGLGDAPLERELVRFELGEDAPPELGWFTSETSITDSQGYAESVFILALSAINLVSTEPLTVPVEITLPGYENPDGSDVSVETSFEIRPLIVRPDLLPGGVFIISGNGAVGHKKFYTRGAPLRVVSPFGAGMNVNFAVIDGRGTIKPELGLEVEASTTFILEKFPDRGITTDVPAGKTRMLTLQPTFTGEASVSYEAADDQNPGIIAIFLDSAIDGAYPVFGAVAPPDVRIVSLDGQPLGGIEPADPRQVDLSTSGFLLEARLPVGFDLDVRGRLATLTRQGELAVDFPEAVAPVALDDIPLTDVGVDELGLGSTWRSDPSVPFVPILETFPNPADKPSLSGPFTPIQMPDHGWILPKTVLVGATTNDEGPRGSDPTPRVTEVYFYDAKSPHDTTPPERLGGIHDLVGTEPPTPILSKSWIRRSPLGFGLEVPVVYCIQTDAVTDAKLYYWTVADPDGEEIVLKQTKDPRLHLWIQDDPANTTTDDGAKEADGSYHLDPDGPVSPAILGIAETEANLRAERFIRCTALNSSGRIVGHGSTPVLWIATRTSFDLGPTRIPAQDHLWEEFPAFDDDDMNLDGDPDGRWDQGHYVPFHFTDPPHGPGLETDEDVDAYLTGDVLTSPEGYEVFRWRYQLRGIRVGITDYWTKSEWKFGSPDVGHRIIWLGSPTGDARVLTATQSWSYHEIDSMLRDVPAPAWAPQKSYGVAVPSYAGALQGRNDADLRLEVLVHERLHVIENSYGHEREFALLGVPGTVEYPYFHSVLMGRAIESFRELYRRNASEPDAIERARSGFIRFQNAHNEVGPYANEIRWFRPSAEEFLYHPCRKPGQTYERDRDLVLGSHSLYFVDSLSFVLEYSEALGESFAPVPWVPDPGHPSRTVAPLGAAGDIEGEARIRERLLDYFARVYWTVRGPIPSLDGGELRIWPEAELIEFKTKLRNAGSAKSPWVIYRPVE